MPLKVTVLPSNTTAAPELSAVAGWNAREAADDLDGEPVERPCPTGDRA